jgi:hypothetical protein
MEWGRHERPASSPRFLGRRLDQDERDFPTLRSEVLAAAGVSDRMALKMRATGLGSPVDECLTDFTVLTGEWVIGPELGLAA